MKAKSALLLFFSFCAVAALGQNMQLGNKKDTLTDDGFFLNITNYKKRVCNEFQIGAVELKLPGETADQFVKRLFPKSETVKTPVEINEWKFAAGKAFLSFQRFSFHKVFRQGQIVKQESIVGLLFVPLNEEGHYKIVRINEIMTNGGTIDIKSVFFTNADGNNQDPELAVIVGETFSKHGTLYDTYFYKNRVSNNKLRVLGSLSEHCDYKEVKKGDHWDYMYQEEENVPTRYIDCMINSSEKINAQLKAKGLSMLAKQ